MSKIDKSSASSSNQLPIVDITESTIELVESKGQLNPDRPQTSDSYVREIPIPSQASRLLQVLPAYDGTMPTHEPTSRNHDARANDDRTRISRQQMMLWIMSGRARLADVDEPAAITRTRHVSELLGIASVTAALMVVASRTLAAPMAALAFWTLPFMAAGAASKALNRSPTGRGMRNDSYRLARNILNVGISGIAASAADDVMRDDIKKLPPTKKLNVLMMSSQTKALDYLRKHASATDMKNNARANISMLSITRSLDKANKSAQVPRVQIMSISDIRRHFFPNAQDCSMLRTQISIASGNISTLTESAKNSKIPALENQVYLLRKILSVIKALNNIAESDNADGYLFA